MEQKVENVQEEKKEIKKDFEEMLQYFDLPHKTMKNNVYILGKNIVVRLLGDADNLIGLEEE